VKPKQKALSKISRIKHCGYILNNEIDFYSTDLVGYGAIFLANSMAGLFYQEPLCTQHYPLKCEKAVSA
jgi:hypothetical protein